MAIDNPIRISTNLNELQDESEFLAEITADEISPSQHGPQYHLAVKPLNFHIAGKTGWFHEWAKISRHKRSKLGVMIVKFSEVFGADKLLGQGAMLGQRAWFIRQDIKFGTDRETGEEMIAEAVLMPTRPMAPGDEALILPDGAPVAGAPKAAVAVPTEYTDEQVGLLLSAIDGADAKRLAIVAARTNLPAELKQAVMSGAALTYLTEHGFAEVGSDGKVHDLVTTPAATNGTGPTFSS